MGLDSYLYKTTRRKFTAWREAHDKALAMFVKNETKLGLIRDERDRLLDSFIKKYPELKNINEKDPASILSDDEVKQIKSLDDRYQRLSGERLFSSVDRKPGKILAYWRKYFGLHSYVIQNFYKGTGGGDPNTERIPLEKDDLAMIIRAMESTKTDELSIFRENRFYTIENIEKDIATLTEILNNYKDTDLVYYWSWY